VIAMTRKERLPVRFSKGLFGRLILSYFVVPFATAAPALIVVKFVDRRIGIADLFWWVVPLGIFGFGTMVVLGTPFLFCYFRLGWTGFWPFVLGGGICAAITARIFLQGDPVLLLLYFALQGMVAGAAFRAILFGFRRKAGAACEL